MVAKGFLASVFDFSFTSFITSKLIRLLYGVAVGVAGLAALVVFTVLVGAGFCQSAAAGVGAIVLGFLVGPLVFFLIALYARVALELTMVMFRIAEHTASIAEAKQRQPAQ